MSITSARKVPGIRSMIFSMLSSFNEILKSLFQVSKQKQNRSVLSLVGALSLRDVVSFLVRIVRRNNKSRLSLKGRVPKFIRHQIWMRSIWPERWILYFVDSVMFDKVPWKFPKYAEVIDFDSAWFALIRKGIRPIYKHQLREQSKWEPIDLFHPSTVYVALQGEVGQWKGV